MVPPRVFISYSHDSIEHKKWVLDFATTLRNRGVDAVIDQWDLKPGDDLPHFMETELVQAQYVLMVCSNRYVDKANAGEGGVGYEKMILTSNYLSRIDASKVIPIIRQSSGTYRVPTFLATKLFVDFSKDSEVEFSFDELLRHLLDAPLYEKPEIGANPFVPMKGAAPDRRSDGIKEVMKGLAHCFDGSASGFVYFSSLLSSVSMHRIALDKYLSDAKKEGLVVSPNLHPDRLVLTEKGREYIFEHGIVEL
ncbi:toll/interleukin-1 receptor domain-containing protein [Vibrio cholerae]|nr:toll/interleukin-1 receptor domain-containing protein [Vibrio cholerae]